MVIGLPRTLVINDEAYLNIAQTWIRQSLAVK